MSTDSVTKNNNWNHGQSGRCEGLTERDGVQVEVTL